MPMKEWTNLQNLLEKQGWRKKRNRRGGSHSKFYCPCQKKHFVVVMDTGKQTSLIKVFNKIKKLDCNFIPPEIKRGKIS